MEIESAIRLLEDFRGQALREKISHLESNLDSMRSIEISKFIGKESIGENLLVAASSIKRASSQIDVVIHSVGIINSLPYILEKDEYIVQTSLGAGTSNADFDLETNLKVCEFKFINWQANGNAVRKKTLFEDYVKLSLADTYKEKRLYVLNSSIPIKFLNGKSKISRLLDRNKRLRDKYYEHFGESFEYVNEFYSAQNESIQILDLINIVPNMKALVW